MTAELARWDIAVEDSAGIPLSDTPAGRLARLAAEAAADDLRPVRLLALLAHPLVRLGLPRETVEHAASVLEIGVLRGPAPALGIDGHARGSGDTSRRGGPPRAAAAQAPDRGRLGPRRRAAASGSASPSTTFTPAAHGEGKLDLMALVEHHRRAVELLWTGADDAPDEQDDDASQEALAALFDDLENSDIRAEEGHPLAGPLRRLSRLLHRARQAAYH